MPGRVERELPQHRGSRSDIGVDRLGHLLALHATPANAQDREPGMALADAVHAATGQVVEVASVDQGKRWIVLLP